MLLAHISLVIVFVFVFSHRKVLVNISKTEIRPNLCSASSGYQISGSSDKPRWAGWEFLCCWLGLRTRLCCKLSILFVLNICCQLDAEFPAYVSHLAEVSHLTTVFSSSVNFYIYLVKYHHLLPTSPQTVRSQIFNTNQPGKYFRRLLYTRATKEPGMFLRIYIKNFIK